MPFRCGLFSDTLVSTDIKIENKVGVIRINN